MISPNSVLDVLNKKSRCVMRQDGKSCDRHCEMCNLVLPSNVVLEAYEYVAGLVKKEMNKK